MINRYLLDSIKWMDLLEFMMDLDIKYYLEGNNLILFTTGLDIYGCKKWYYI